MASMDTASIELSIENLSLSQTSSSPNHADATQSVASEMQEIKPPKSSSNIAQYDRFVSCLARFQTIRKEEQQAPSKRDPLAWREETTRTLDQCLEAVEQLITNPQLLKDAKLVEGELFNKCENLFRLCIDESGVSELDAKKRFNRVSTIIGKLLSSKSGKRSLFKPPQVRLLSSIRDEALADSFSSNSEAVPKSMPELRSKNSLTLLDNMCEERFLSLIAPEDRLQKIEEIRIQLMDRLSTSTRFQKDFRNGGGLHIFGSSLATLATPASDVDFCLRLPSVGIDMNKNRQKLEEAKSSRMALENACPVMHEVRQLLDLKPKFTNVDTSLRSRKSKVSLREEAVAVSKKDLDKKKLQIEKEKEKRSQVTSSDSEQAAKMEKEHAERDDKLAREETKLANRLKSDEQALKDAEKKLDEAKAEFKKLKTREQLLLSVIHKQFPAEKLSEFIKRFDRLQRTEKSAQNSVLETGKIVYAVSQTIHSTRNFPPLPQRAFNVVGRARVPVVKVTEQALGVAFDIVVNNEIALRNSLLIAAYATDPRARRVIFLVKAWAKNLKLNDAPNGTPSSYCHALLVIFFLMQTPEDVRNMMDQKSKELKKQTCAPILPNLQAVPGLESYLVDGFETKFEPDLEKARKAGGNELPVDGRSVPELLVDYFKWLTWLLQHANRSCVSIKQGKLLPDKHTMWRNAIPWRMSVEDPFETSDSPRPHDLSQVITRGGKTRLLDACKKVRKLEDAMGANTSTNNDDWVKFEEWNSFLGLKYKKVPGAVKTSPATTGKVISNVSGGGGGGGGGHMTQPSANIPKASITSRLGPAVAKPSIASRLGPPPAAAEAETKSVVDYQSVLIEIDKLLLAEITKSAQTGKQGVVTVNRKVLMNAFKQKMGFALTKEELSALPGNKGRIIKPLKLLESFAAKEFIVNGKFFSFCYSSDTSPSQSQKVTKKPKKQKTANTTAPVLPPSAATRVETISVHSASTSRKAEAQLTQEVPHPNLSEKELIVLLENLFKDGRWKNLAAIKARFFTENQIKLRPALFSGKPLEKVLCSIPSLKYSEGNNGNSSPRWRYQGRTSISEKP